MSHRGEHEAAAFEPARLAWDLAAPVELASVVPIEAGRAEPEPLRSIG